MLVKQVVQPVRSFALHRWYYVRVRIERQSDLGVTEALLHDLGVGTLEQRKLESESPIRFTIRSWTFPGSGSTPPHLDSTGAVRSNPGPSSPESAPMCGPDHLDVDG